MQEIVKRVQKSKKKLFVATINAHSFVEAESDAEFRSALENADILLPDGDSISIATHLFRLNPRFNHRIPGPDFFEQYTKHAKNATYFFIGASDKVLKRIKDRMKKEHPHISVHTYAPPMYPFSKEENDKIIKTINRIKPDVVWVGMTAPKQEKWAYENKDYLKTKMICPIGAAFDFYAGTKKRAPIWLRKIRSEWLYRLFLEPRRMYKRYIINNIKFLIYMGKIKQ